MPEIYSLTYLLTYLLTEHAFVLRVCPIFGIWRILGTFKDIEAYSIIMR